MTVSYRAHTGSLSLRDRVQNYVSIDIFCFKNLCLKIFFNVISNVLCPLPCLWAYFFENEQKNLKKKQFKLTHPFLTAHINVAETVKQLTELKHMPASPGIVRRSLQQLSNNTTNTNNSPQQPQQQSPTTPSLSTFQQAKSNFSSSTSLNSTGNLNPIYGQTGHRIMAYVENSMYVRKNSLNSSNSDLINAGEFLAKFCDFS